MRRSEDHFTHAVRLCGILSIRFVRLTLGTVDAFLAERTVVQRAAAALAALEPAAANCLASLPAPAFRQHRISRDRR